jgi:hypothetical protein
MGQPFNLGPTYRRQVGGRPIPDRPPDKAEPAPRNKSGHRSLTVVDTRSSDTKGKS